MKGSGNCSSAAVNCFEFQLPSLSGARSVSVKLTVYQVALEIVLAQNDSRV